MEEKIEWKLMGQDEDREAGHGQNRLILWEINLLPFKTYLVNEEQDQHWNNTFRHSFSRLNFSSLLTPLTDLCCVLGHEGIVLRLIHKNSSDIPFSCCFYCSVGSLCLQQNICFSAWRTTTPSSFSDLGAASALSYSCSLLLSPSDTSSPFLNIFFHRPNQHGWWARFCPGVMGTWSWLAQHPIHPERPG